MSITLTINYLYNCKTIYITVYNVFLYLNHANIHYSYLLLQFEVLKEGLSVIYLLKAAVTKYSNIL